MVVSSILSAIAARARAAFSFLGISAAAVILLAILIFLANHFYLSQKLTFARQELGRITAAQEQLSLNNQAANRESPIFIDSIFLSPDDITNVSRKLHELQEKHSLQLLRTSFKDDLTSASLPPGIEIQMAVKGQYLQVRKMALASLNQIRALSLQTLDIKRTSADTSPGDPTTIVDAVITLRLFIKAGS
jgi:hypothetical protein